MQKKPRRAMSEDERAMAAALGRCSFCPATASKRFAEQMAATAASGEPTITEGQAAFLRESVIRFRRQIVGTIVEMAGEKRSEDGSQRSEVGSQRSEEHATAMQL